MSTIGKVFIVLNLLMSAAFLGWAANAVATNQDFKTQLEQEQAARKAEKEDLEGQLATSRANATAQEAGKVDAIRQVEDRDATIDRKETELRDLKRENTNLKSKITSIEQSLSDYNDKLGNLESSYKQAVADTMEMRGERDGAQQAQQDAELAQAEAEENLRTAQAQIRQLETNLNATADRLSTTETHLETLAAMTNTTLNEIMPVPFIQGTVLSVRSDLPPGLVALNVGANDQVKKGMTFEIYQGSEYKGSVQVENVRPDMCSALVTRSVPGTSMREGDTASTRL